MCVQMCVCVHVWRGADHSCVRPHSHLGHDFSLHVREAVYRQRTGISADASQRDLWCRWSKPESSLVQVERARRVKVRNQLSLHCFPLEQQPLPPPPSLQLEHARPDDQPLCLQLLVGHPPGSVHGSSGTRQLRLA